jgi:hypothetical protein
MMKRRRTIAVLLLALSATPVIAGEFSHDLQRKLGLKTVTVSAGPGGATVSGFARVLDAVPLAILDADLASAAASASASESEARRTRELAAADSTVSRKVAEAAAAQARADALRYELLQRRLGLEWGPVFMKMGAARRSSLISSLAAGRAALVRLDAPAGLAGIPRATISRPGGGQVSVQILGQARVGDPRFQAPGMLGLVTGADATDFATGLVYTVSFSVSGASGVLLPRSALIRAGGRTFVYVRRDATHFEKRNLSGLQSRADGMLAIGGIRPGEVVVASGAAALFAAESKSKGEEE